MKDINYDPTTHYRNETAGCGWGGTYAWADAEVTADVIAYRAWHYNQLKTALVTWPFGTAPSYSDLLDMLAIKNDGLSTAVDTVNNMLESDDAVAEYRALAKAERQAFEDRMAKLSEEWPSTYLALKEGGM